MDNSSEIISLAQVITADKVTSPIFTDPANRVTHSCFQPRSYLW